MSQQDCNTLSDQLARYSAAAQATAKQKTSSHLSAKWPVYATAVGSALALTTNAHADIIYSGPQSVTASASQNMPKARASFTVDSEKFLLEVGYPNAGRFKLGFASIAGRYDAASILANRNGAVRLASGAVISGSVSGRFSSSAVLAEKGFIKGGSFNGGQSGFVGVEIGGSNFGWVKLNVASGKNGYPQSVTALGWAYETVAKQSILAGQTAEISATPEPASASLMLLAAGAGGVLAWRKRRTGMATAA